MTDPPRELQDLDRHFAAGTLTHEYVADIHFELVALGLANTETRALLHEAAAIILKRMPELAHDVRELADQLSAQHLLDPPAAAATRSQLRALRAEVEPALQSLRERQNEIAATLRDKLDRAAPG